MTFYFKTISQRLCSLVFLILKKKRPGYFTSQVSLFRNNRISKHTRVNHRQVQRTEERGLLLWRKGENWEELFVRVQGGNSLSLAECGGFLLAGLLSDQEKFLLSLAGLCKVTFILFGVWLWGSVWEFLLGFLTPFLMKLNLNSLILEGFIQNSDRKC